MKKRTNEKILKNTENVSNDINGIIRKWIRIKRNEKRK